MITPNTDNTQLMSALFSNNDADWTNLISIELSIVDFQKILSRNKTGTSTAQLWRTTRLLNNLIEDRDDLIALRAEQEWSSDPTYKDISQFDRWQRTATRLRALVEPLSQLTWMDYFVERDRKYLSGEGL